MDAIGEPFKVRDTYKECDYGYGGEDYIITADDLIALARGKILNGDINWEYGFTLKLAPDALATLINYMNKGAI